MIRSRHGRRAVLAIIAVLASAAATLAQPAARTITIYACVPQDVGTVYLTGNRPELGPWDPHKFAMEGTGPLRSSVLRVPDGMELEFKFTLGSWRQEGFGPQGKIAGNYRLAAKADTEVGYELAGFKNKTDEYIDDWKSSGVLGRLEYWKNVPSKHLAGSRHVEIWLPPEYELNPMARYPVIYMHDGQQLFDPRLANFDGWAVDKAIVRGVKAGRIPPMIVVGVWSTERRIRELCPWDLGPDYARFLIEELMPRVNKDFRTLTGPQNTSTIGSSMGGLISFWLCWKHPDVFGKGGCLSSAFPFSSAVYFQGDPSKLPAGPATSPIIEREIAGGATFPRGPRLYFDYGTLGGDASIAPAQAKVNAWLAKQGWVEGQDFTSRAFEGATHNEAAWRARLDEPLTFLFANPSRPN